MDTEREQFIKDIFVTAMEGGIGYWARAHNLERDANGEYLAATLFEFEDVAQDLNIGLIWPADWVTIDDYVLTHPDSVQQYVVTVESIEKAYREAIAAYILDGEKIAADDYMNRFVQALAEKDAGLLDALDADILVQYACFGEVVYG